MPEVYRTVTRGLWSLVIPLLVMFGPGEAWGQGTCAPLASVVERAKTEYGEVPVVRGLERGGLVMTILASPEGSWTMLAVNPMGLACVVATGTAWQQSQPGRGA